MATTILAVCIILFAGGVSGLAGFGFALVSVPFLLLLYDPTTVVVLSNSLTLISLWLVVMGHTRAVLRPTLSGLVPSAAAGLALGVVILRGFDADLIKLIVSVVVIAFALVLVRGWVPRWMLQPWATAVAGFASGTLNSATGLSGPPVVLLLTARHVPPLRFRVTTSSYFFIIDIITLGVLAVGGFLRWEHFALVALLAPVAALGTIGGRYLAGKVEPETFRRVTLGLLIVSGISSAVSALL